MIRYPVAVQSDLDRVEYCTRALERLRLHHNAQGARKRSGAITADQWRAFVEDDFNPKSAALNHALNQARVHMVRLDEKGEPEWTYDKELLKRSARFDEAIELDKIEGEGRKLATVDPLEDYTGYTEVDPESSFSVAQNTITATNLGNDSNGYIYKDKGVDHFDGDFEHLVEFNCTSIDLGGKVGLWAVANALDEYTGLRANNTMLAVRLFCATGPVRRILLESAYLGSNSNDTYNGLSLSTDYYLKIKRDESVGTYGTIYCYIYSDSDRTTLVDTLSVTIASIKEDYRYIYAALGSDDSSPTEEADLTISNLDLQEGGGPAAVTRCRIVHV